ncbi:M20/M25/M40 family metallo-hydrolase [Geomicrobium sediminis]|uniref:Acetylornithine deacetylase/succinyl-diaminopimelate desuccinylase-like protein n=1 Tax=Geomicrobium sediminis TaxID=1347788 RepID=A0ABS2PCI5_9BACL|nr:M20/M25/M40 family metallo-hydrolase [Geomicrobium sediminis]MBM7632821.1 acetylornithine deacetylase/succinyl-diaminopimelate desuccinylase-like protein [Geomicrobium sediminis]
MNFKQHIAENKDHYLNDLFTLLRQKSISAQNDGVRDCAALVVGKLKEAGIAHVEIIETDDHPVVYAEQHVSDDAPTMLIYGHYDVQPPDPLDEWKSPPFEPTIRDGKIYARGVGDNKGQMLAQILAAQTYIATAGELPLNVKFVFEGEEEIGSKNLPTFVETHKEKLAADFVYTSDGPMLSSGNPYVLLGTRGMLYVELKAKGSDFDNHSGNKGNIAQNPAWKIIELLQSMRDDEGNILIEGFYDDVEAPTDLERQLLEQLPFNIEELREQVGDQKIDLSKADYYKKLCFEPTFNIAGFSSGYSGEGAKTIIPSEATVKMDMRLVNNQDPDEIFERFKAHVSKFALDITVAKIGAMSPSRTSANYQIVETVREATERSFERKTFIQPSLGGSLPNHVWTNILGVPSVIVPYANADEANHSPNENLVVDNFYKGILCTCEVMKAASQMTKDELLQKRTTLA